MCYCTIVILCCCAAIVVPTHHLLHLQLSIPSNIMASFTAATASSKVQQEMLRQTFMRMDTDHDLTISLDELISAVQSDDVAHSMMRSMDSDNNGRIDFKEFCKGFEKAQALTGNFEEEEASPEELAAIRDKRAATTGNLLQVSQGAVVQSGARRVYSAFWVVVQSGARVNSAFWAVVQSGARVNSAFWRSFGRNSRPLSAFAKPVVQSGARVNSAFWWPFGCNSRPT